MTNGEDSEQSEATALEEDLLVDEDSAQSLASESDDSWDDEEDGSLGQHTDTPTEDEPAAQHTLLGGATASAATSPGKALGAKAGGWFKRAFTAAGRPSSTIERLSTTAAASVSDATPTSFLRGSVQGSPTRRRGVSRLSARTAAAGEAAEAAASVRSASASSMASDAPLQDAEGAALPSPEAGAQVPLGQRLPTHLHRKLHKDLADLALVQEVDAHAGVVWDMAFNATGQLLATAGQDGVVRLWRVLPHREVNNATQSTDGSSSSATSAGHANAVPGHEGCPVFADAPHRNWRDHEQEVLCLAWAPSDFLLSGSMDGTARLWHPTLEQCLRVFRHTEWVTAVQFSPRDDQRFMSATVDGRVRVWSITEQRVLDSADVHEMVTAAAWAPDGCRAAVATLKGKVRFYGIDEHGRLEYEAQIDVKNRRGKSTSGRKVTGLQYQPLVRDGGGSGGSSGPLLLVTSADARLRLFDGYALVSKLKGPTLGDSNIRAAFSPDGRSITCGSEDSWAFVWDIYAGGAPTGSLPAEKIAAFEAFMAGSGAAHVVLAAPLTARRTPEALARAAANRLTAPWTSQQPSMSRASKTLSKPAAEAVAAAEADMKASCAFGAVFVAALDSGKIVVAENLAAPHWV